VASCLPCNKRKANKLLHEIPDMKLLRTPRPMTIHTSRQLLRNQSAADPLWRKYLFFEQNNINTWSEHA